MKYIRTKDDKIIQVEREVDMFGKTQTVVCEFVCDVDGNVIYGREPKYESKIKAEADTIEELCDEFVLIHTEDDNSKDIFQSYGGRAKHRGDSYYDFNFEEIRTGRIIISGVIYAAIWTDKGLIYVAKMNEKGEFKLL